MKKKLLLLIVGLMAIVGMLAACEKQKVEDTPPETTVEEDYGDVIVNFNLDDGTFMTGQNSTVKTDPKTGKVTLSGDSFDPTFLVKRGYEFSHWFKKVTHDGDPVVQEVVIDLATTIFECPEGQETLTVELYAKWIAITYTVQYNNELGKIHEEVFTFGTPKALWNGATKDGYVLTGWKDAAGAVYGANAEIEEAFTVVKGETVVLKAIFQQVLKQTYVVTFFDGIGGNEIIRVTSSATTGCVTLPQNPAKDYFNFVRWTMEGGVPFTATTEVTKAMSVYANFSGYKYTINYIPQVGAGADTYTMLAGGYASSPYRLKVAPQNGQKVFAGWSTTVDGAVEFEGETYLPLTAFPKVDNSTITLYAIYEYPVVEVMFSELGKSFATSKETGTIAEFPTAPEKVGAAFVGWYLNPQFTGEMVTEETEFYANATVYAKFENFTYTVEFVNPEDAGSVAYTQAFSYGTVQALTLNAFEAPAGKVFAGWATTLGGAIAYLDGADVSNLTAVDNATVTLYAVFTGDTSILVTFVSNGQVFQQVNVNAENKLESIPTIARAGYAFGGWFLAGVEIDIDNEYSASATYTAAWTAYTLTVSYYFENTLKGTQVFTYDGSTTINDSAFALPAQIRFWAATNGAEYVSGTQYGKAGSLLNLNALTTNGDATLRLDAIYQVYTVSFDNGIFGREVVNSSSIYGNISAATIGAMESAFNSDPNMLGYALIGFFFKAGDGSMNVRFTEGYNVALTASQNITVYAVWESVEYTVVFHDENGVVIGTKTFQYGAKPQIVFDGLFDIKPEVEAGYAENIGGALAVWNYHIEKRDQVLAPNSWYTIGYDITGGFLDTFVEGVWDGVKAGLNGAVGGIIPEGATFDEVNEMMRQMALIQQGVPPETFAVATAAQVCASMNIPLAAIDAGVSGMVAPFGLEFPFTEINILLVAGQTIGEDVKLGIDPSDDYGLEMILKTDAYPSNFVGWATTLGGDPMYGALFAAPNLTTTAGKTINLFAKKQVAGATFTIFYNMNGGVGNVAPSILDKKGYGGHENDTRELRYHEFFTDGVANASIPVRYGYTFVGWDTNPNNLDGYRPILTYVVDENTPDSNTLYAYWQPNAGTLQFHPQGGTNGLDDLTVSTGIKGSLDVVLNGLYDAWGTPMADIVSTPYYLPKNTTVRQGYRFIGWMKTPEPNGGYNEQTPVDYADGAQINIVVPADDATVTLYARWIATNGRELQINLSTIETKYIVGETPWFSQATATLTAGGGAPAESLTYSQMVFYGDGLNTDVEGVYYVYFYYGGYAAAIQCTVVPAISSNHTFTGINAPSEIDKYNTNKSNAIFQEDAPEFYIGTSNAYLASPQARVTKMLSGSTRYGQAITLSTYVPTMQILEGGIDKTSTYINNAKTNLQNGEIWFTAAAEEKTVTIRFNAGGDHVEYSAMITKGYNIYNAAQLSIINNANHDKTENVWDDRDASHSDISKASYRIATYHLFGKGLGYMYSDGDSQHMDRLTPWREFKHAKGVVSNPSALCTRDNPCAECREQENAAAVILQRDIKVTLNDIIPNVLDKNLKDEFGVPRLADWQQLYLHMIPYGEKFSIIGNYFTLDTFNIPWVGRGKESDRSAAAQQNGFVYSKSQVFYIVGEHLVYEDTAQTLPVDPYGPQNHTRWAQKVQSNPNATLGTADKDFSHLDFKNIRMIGNTGRIENIKGSGGLMFVEVENIVDCNFNNIHASKFTSAVSTYERVASKPNYESAMVTRIDRCIFTDMFMSGITNWEGAVIELTNSEISMTGGPAIVLFDDGNELLEYDFVRQGGQTSADWWTQYEGDQSEGRMKSTAMRNTPTIRMDEHSFENTNTAAKGGEAFFVVNMITAMVTQIKAVSTFYGKGLKEGNGRADGMDAGFVGSYFGNADGTKLTQKNGASVTQGFHDKAKEFINMKIVVQGSVSSLYGDTGEEMSCRVEIMNPDRSTKAVIIDTQAFYHTEYAIPAGVPGFGGMNPAKMMLAGGAPALIKVNDLFARTGVVVCNPLENTFAVLPPVLNIGDPAHQALLAGGFYAANNQTVVSTLVGWGFVPSSSNLNNTGSRYSILAQGFALCAIVDRVIPDYTA